MKFVNSVLIVGAFIGCGGREKSEPATKLPNVCAPPDCCVSIGLGASNVRLYVASGQEKLLLTIERVDTDSANNYWSPSVSVTTDSGEAVQCDNVTQLEPSQRYLRLRCETPDSWSRLACNATADLQIRIQSSSTSVTGKSAADCDGSHRGITISYTVPLECSSCPDGVMAGASCDLPLYCSDGWMMPCQCEFDPVTGKGTWSCAIA